MDNTWRFEFIDSTQQEQGIESGVADTMGSGANEKSKTKTSKKGFSERFTEKTANNLLQSTVISPLNTVTGGLASPLYRSAKQIMSGASAGAIASGLAVAGLQLAINQIEKRVSELQAKTETLNNSDNALIRAGSVSKGTYYTSNIFGIKKTTNRS